MADVKLNVCVRSVHESLSVFSSNSLALFSLKGSIGRPEARVVPVALRRLHDDSLGNMLSSVHMRHILYMARTVHDRIRECVSSLEVSRMKELEDVMKNVLNVNLEV